MRLIPFLARLLSELALWLYDRPRAAAMLMLVLTLAALSQLPRLELDNSVGTLLGLESPAFTSYQSFTERFGNDVYVVVTVSATDVLAPQSLQKLERLHKDLESVAPHVRRVTSLLNAPRLHRRQQRTVISGLLNPWPDSEQAWQAWQQEVLASERYHNKLINLARNFTVIVLQLSNDMRVADKRVPMSTLGYAELVDAIKPVLASHQEEDFSLQITGEAAADAATYRAFLQQILMLGLASVAVGLLLVWLLFRRRIAVLLPLIIIVSTVIFTFSTVALLGQPLYITLMILPPLIVGLGVADSLHLLNAYYRYIEQKNAPRQAFSLALKETAGAVLMTTLTTAVGLLSFMFVGIQGLSSFGLYAGIATVFACLLTFIFTALVLAWSPNDGATTAMMFGRREAINRVASFCVALAGRHAGKIIIMTILTGILAIYALNALRLNNDPLLWVPDSWSEVRGMRLLDQHFQTASAFELVIDSGAVGGIRQASFIQSLRALAKDFRQHEAAEIFSTIYSVESYLADISRAMDGRSLDYTEFTNGDDLVWRDLRFFQIGMADTFSTMVSRDYRYARMTLATSRDWAVEYDTPRRVIDEVLARHPTLAKVEVTGFLPILRHSLDVITAGAAVSFVVSMLMVFIMIALFFSNARMAMLSMLPNVVPILLILALFTLAGVTLDIITIMVGSITIGIIVDDTIHFLNNFKIAQAAGQPVAQCCEHALQTSGHAMLVTSLVLIGALSVLIFSEIGIISFFGIISSAILMLGLLADFLLMPAIMQWLYRHEGKS